MKIRVSVPEGRHVPLPDGRVLTTACAPEGGWEVDDQNIFIVRRLNDGDLVPFVAPKPRAAAQGA